MPQVGRTDAAPQRPTYAEFAEQCGGHDPIVEAFYRAKYGEPDEKKAKARREKEQAALNGPLRVADILRHYGPEYFQTHKQDVCLAQRRALAELTACRTPAMGSYDHECPDCGKSFFGGYNSCRNRHCPSCGGPTRAKWFARVEQDVLPVPYFHLVFTLPNDLSQLVLANRKLLYGLLFRACWATIRKLAADPKHLGGKPAATMVLHTWSQMLDHHPHVHCVMPGGAVSSSGKWVPSRSQKFLFPYKVVSRIFRGKFLDGLKRLHAKGKLRLAGKLFHLADRQVFEQWLKPLYQKCDWVVHLQKAPDGCQGPQAVLKYLARYVAGTAISDKRLIGHEDGRVRFWVKDRKRGGKRVQRSLPGAEFTRRFLLHVLPPGFRRVRHYGWLSNPQRRQQVPRVRALLPEAEKSSSTAEEPPARPDAPSQHKQCPACGGGPLTKIGSVDTPSSWAQVLLASPYATANDRAWHAPAQPAHPVGTIPPYQDTS